MERTKISHQQFFALCEALRSAKNRLVKERPKKVVAAEQLSKVLEFTVPMSSLEGAIKATGVEWYAARSTDQRSVKVSADAYATILKCLCNLYAGLGEPVPAELLALVAGEG